MKLLHRSKLVRYWWVLGLFSLIGSASTFDWARVAIISLPRWSMASNGSRSVLGIPKNDEFTNCSNLAARAGLWLSMKFNVSE